jgi:hypothetical protein
VAYAPRRDRGDLFGAVAQLVAHRTGSAGVTGSNPVSSTTACDLRRLVTTEVSFGAFEEFATGGQGGWVAFEGVGGDPGGDVSADRCGGGTARLAPRLVLKAR